jgi:hypothetical protein
MQRIVKNSAFLHNSAKGNNAVKIINWTHTAILNPQPRHVKSACEILSGPRLNQRLFLNNLQAPTERLRAL